eukprot:651045-Amphidinium_carterae.1
MKAAITGTLLHPIVKHSQAGTDGWTWHARDGSRSASKSDRLRCWPVAPKDQQLVVCCAFKGRIYQAGRARVAILLMVYRLWAAMKLKCYR